MSQPSSSNADLVRDGGRSGKSATAFRTISEVATDLDVAQHVLRFWESKFPQVRPLKRGGGRRYYRPEDVELLRQIRSFLYDEGYTIKGVQKLLKTRRGRDEAEGGRDAAAPRRHGPSHRRRLAGGCAPPLEARAIEPARPAARCRRLRLPCEAARASL